MRITHPQQCTLLPGTSLCVRCQFGKECRPTEDPQNGSVEELAGRDLRHSVHSRLCQLGSLNVWQKMCQALVLTAQLGKVLARPCHWTDTHRPAAGIDGKNAGGGPTSTAKDMAELSTKLTQHVAYAWVSADPPAATAHPERAAQAAEPP